MPMAAIPPYPAPSQSGVSAGPFRLERPDADGIPANALKVGTHAL